MLIESSGPVPEQYGTISLEFKDQGVGLRVALDVVDVARLVEGIAALVAGLIDNLFSDRPDLAVAFISDFNTMTVEILNDKNPTLITLMGIHSLTSRTAEEMN